MSSFDRYSLNCERDAHFSLVNSRTLIFTWGIKALRKVQMCAKAWERLYAEWYAEYIMHKWYCISLGLLRKHCFDISPCILVHLCSISKYLQQWLFLSFVHTNIYSIYASKQEFLLLCFCVEVELGRICCQSGGITAFTFFFFCFHNILHLWGKNAYLCRNANMFEPPSVLGF